MPDTVFTAEGSQRADGSASHLTHHTTPNQPPSPDQTPTSGECGIDTDTQQAHIIHPSEIINSFCAAPREEPTTSQEGLQPPAGPRLNASQDLPRLTAVPSLLFRRGNTAYGGLLDSPVTMMHSELPVSRAPLSPPPTVPASNADLPDGQPPISVSYIGSSWPLARSYTESDESQDSAPGERKTTLSNEGEETLQDMLGSGVDLLPLQSPINSNWTHPSGSALLSTVDYDRVEREPQPSPETTTPPSMSMQSPPSPLDTFPIDDLQSPDDRVPWNSYDPRDLTRIHQNTQRRRLSAAEGGDSWQKGRVRVSTFSGGLPTPTSSLDDEMEDIEMWPPTDDMGPPRLTLFPNSQNTQTTLLQLEPHSHDVFAPPYTVERNMPLSPPLSVDEDGPSINLLPSLFSLFEDDTNPLITSSSTARRATIPEFIGFDEYDATPSSPSRRTFSPLPSWDVLSEETGPSSPPSSFLLLPGEDDMDGEMTPENLYPHEVYIPNARTLLFIDDPRDLPSLDSPSPEDYEMDLPWEDDVDPESELGKLIALRRKAMMSESAARQAESSIMDPAAVHQRAAVRREGRKERERAKEIAAMVKLTAAEQQNERNITVGGVSNMSQLVARMLFRRHEIVRPISSRRFGLMNDRVASPLSFTVDIDSWQV